MMKTYGYNEEPKVAPGKTAGGSLYLRVSKGIRVILSFIINQPGNKMSGAHYTKRPGVENCVTVFQGVEAIPGNVKTNSGCIKTISEYPKASQGRLETNEPNLETVCGSLKTISAALKKSGEVVKHRPGNIGRHYKVVRRGEAVEGWTNVLGRRSEIRVRMHTLQRAAATGIHMG
jgi:hypothetical protein